jgi:hypothetical protein
MKHLWEDHLAKESAYANLNGSGRFFSSALAQFNAQPVVAQTTPPETFWLTLKVPCHKPMMWRCLHAAGV